MEYYFLETEIKKCKMVFMVDIIICNRKIAVHICLLSYIHSRKSIIYYSFIVYWVRHVKFFPTSVYSVNGNTCLMSDLTDK